MIATIEALKPDREHDRLHVTFSLNGEKREDTIDEHTRLIPLWLDACLNPLPQSEMKIVTCTSDGEQRVYWIVGSDIPKLMNALHTEEDA